MPPIIATKFPTPVSIVAAPVAKGLFTSTNIAAGYHEQGSIMLHRRPDLAYPLHRKANGLPYAAFVDDKLVRERGLRMVSHFDLLPYSDEKAMKMLSTQWKYHDPAGTYWTTVEECYTLMAVGHVHRSVSRRLLMSLVTLRRLTPQQPRQKIAPPTPRAAVRRKAAQR